MAVDGRSGSRRGIPRLEAERQVSNGEVELIATLDDGPRIISYKLVGGRNVFKEFDDQMGGSGQSEWIGRDGHGRPARGDHPHLCSRQFPDRVLPDCRWEPLISSPDAQYGIRCRH